MGPTQDILSHGPKLNSDTGNLCEIRWGAVFKEGGVGDLSRSPFTLVVWVGDLGDGPFTLVFWVSDLGGGPWSTSSSVFTFRVGDHRWDPISIFLVLFISCAYKHVAGSSLHPIPRASRLLGRGWSRARSQANPQA